MATIELARERWERDLAAFSERNAGRPVRLEVQVPPGEGEPVIADHEPLIGIDFDPKGSDAPAIEIAVGTPSGGGRGHLTHVVREPTQVWMDEETDGLGRALKITSRDEGTTLVLFEPQEALPR
jgi:uncharacterized protein DUF5335